jgi:hypothetical protein
VDAAGVQRRGGGFSPETVPVEIDPAYANGAAELKRGLHLG